MENRELNSSGVILWTWANTKQNLCVRGTVGMCLGIQVTGKMEEVTLRPLEPLGRLCSLSDAPT